MNTGGNVESIDDTNSISATVTNNPINSGDVDDVLSGTGSVESFKSDDTIKAEDVDKKEENPEWMDLLGSGSILKKVIKEGTPDTRPKRLQNCKIRYECTLSEGLLVDKVEDMTLQLGDCEVVQGLDLAIGLMNVGEICILKIEPRLAYGSKGLSPLIPGDTLLIYEIELISVEPEIDPETLTISQRKLMGNKKKEKGNWWYGRGESNLAIQCYRRALDYLDEVEGGIIESSDEIEVTDSALQDLLEDRINVFNNMAAAQVKLGLHDAALNSLQIVLKCQPDNLKALFRKAKVYRAKNDLQTALKCLQRANEVCPNHADIQKEITIISALIQKQKVSERELARRMFNGPKIDKDDDENKGVNDSPKLIIWAILGASLAVGFLGLAAYKVKF